MFQLVAGNRCLTVTEREAEDLGVRLERMRRKDEPVRRRHELLRLIGFFLCMSALMISVQFIPRAWLHTGILATILAPAGMATYVLWLGLDDIDEVERWIARITAPFVVLGVIWAITAAEVMIAVNGAAPYLLEVGGYRVGTFMLHLTAAVLLTCWVRSRWGHGRVFKLFGSALVLLQLYNSLEFLAFQFGAPRPTADDLLATAGQRWIGNVATAVPVSAALALAAWVFMRLRRDAHDQRLWPPGDDDS